MTVQASEMTTARGERRLAALLFADLSGYTRLCRTLDPEDVAATVLPLIAEVRAAATAEGGVATAVAGDGFLAVFGGQVSGTDIADRAARAAVEMRRIVRARNGESKALPVPDIHIGLTAGEVLAYPSDDPTGLSFIGPAINLAARLSDLADAGTILMDEAFRRLLSGDVRLGEPRQLVAQGHEEGVVGWELLDGAGDEAKVVEVPFVGREDLLRQLDDCWVRSCAGSRVQVLHLLGEAGIGKTTVLRNWALRNPRTSTSWINCLDVPFGEHIDAVLHQLRLNAGAADSSRRRLSQSPADPLSVRPDDHVAQRAREVLQLAATARGQGIVLVLDDFQHADDELRDLVDALAASDSARPTLVICATRTDQLASSPDTEAVVVPPLDNAAVATLVEAALGAPAPASVLAALLGRAEGRPLAALQSSAYLVESGTVVVEGDQCLVVHPQRLPDLPDSMRLFVAGRLDRLPPLEKQMLQELSAVGTSVSLDVVTALFGANAVNLLASLHARGLLVHEGSHVRFSHGVVHEVAYASLTRSVRARLHKRMVEEDPARDVAIRALHARRWLACASDAVPAERRQAAAAALHHTRLHVQSLYLAHVRNAYAEARTIRALLEEDADVAPSDAATLLVLLAGCDVHAGRYDEALAEADSAIALCRRHAVESTVLVAALCAQGEALSMLRHYQSARQTLEEALQLSQDCEDMVGRGRALRLLGDTYRHSDSSRLLTLTEEAFHVLVASGDEDGAAEAARTMAYWLSVGTAPRLRKWIEEAEQRTRSDDARGRLALAQTRALAAEARLDAATAREQARTCRQLGNELGIGDAMFDGLLIGVEAAAALGLLDESLSLLAELEQQARNRAEPRARQMAAVVGLQPLQRAGLTDRAAQARSQAVALRDAFGPPETVTAAAALGLAARDRGDWADAIGHLYIALESAEAVGFALSALVLRQELVLTSALCGVLAPDADEVAKLAEQAEAPLIASATRAAVSMVTGEGISATRAGLTLQESAVRADARALQSGRAGEDPRAAWKTAAMAWQRLGSTVFFARAQARSGDVAAAEHTLDVIQASDEGRAWALQR